MNMFDNEKRPRFPEIVVEALEEEKKDPNEGLWKTIVRENPEIKEKVKEKEREKRKNDSLFGKTGDNREPSLEDIL